MKWFKLFKKSKRTLAVCTAEQNETIEWISKTLDDNQKLFAEAQQYALEKYQAERQRIKDVLFRYVQREYPDLPVAENGVNLVRSTGGFWKFIKN